MEKGEREKEPFSIKQWSRGHPAASSPTEILQGNARRSLDEENSKPWKGLLVAGERGLESVRGEGMSQVLLAELREENLAEPALGCVGWRS